MAAPTQQEQYNSLNKAFVTCKAPDFSCNSVMPDGSFKELSLNSYKGKWLCLFFYPLDFTFVCPTELCGFSDVNDKFKALNCEVLGCSLDSVFSHYAWTQQSRKEGGIGKLEYPLLADIHRKVSGDYGCLLAGGDPVCRGLFLIDPEQNIRFISRQHPCVGRNVDETLRLLEAYQFADKHGEVCPLGWTKGKPTIKTDPLKKLEFFTNATEGKKRKL